MQRRRHVQEGALLLPTVGPIADDAGTTKSTFGHNAAFGGTSYDAPMRSLLLGIGIWLLPLAACGTPAIAVVGNEDAGATTGDASTDARDASATDAGKADRCTGTFASDLTAPYGRLDGHVRAILTPADQQCPRPNRTHVILEVEVGGTKVYRMVVNVVSDREPLDVYFATTTHALPAPGFSEGWHPDAKLDYAADLGLHAKQAPFASTPQEALVRRVVDAIALDARVAVYAGTSGGDSAHLVHRNSGGDDGAIVLDADGPKPTFLLFHFDNQAF